MRRVAWLGLVAACLLAACESSKDSLLRAGGGRGGSASGGAGGSTGGSTGGVAGNGTGGTTTGGTGGRACQQVQCLRAYECVLSCDGPVQNNGCCPCEAPRFDNITCGTTGSAGRGGAGGTSTGTGGSTGGSASGGTTGGAGPTGGRGGTSGSGGSAGGRGGTGGTGGTGGAGGTAPRTCEQGLCARQYECVRTCGGPIEYTGCCMCDPPLFDDYHGMTCADGGGQPLTGYVGCTFIGGYDRVVISRCDAAAGIALNMVLVTPTGLGMSTSGLSLPASFALEYVAASASSNCPIRGSTGTTVTSISGTVTWADLVGGAGTLPAHANIDVTVTVQVPGATAPLTATLRAQNVDVRPGCN